MLGRIGLSKFSLIIIRPAISNEGLLFLKISCFSSNMLSIKELMAKIQNRAINLNTFFYFTKNPGILLCTGRWV